jgi:hypothetical protein
MTASRYGVFCLILFFGVLALGVQNYEVWSRSAGAVTKREVPKKPEAKTEAPPSAPSKGEAAGESIPRDAYKAIAEKNIFHPDRQEFPASAGAEQGKPSARPQISLYGVVVAGEHQSATIVNPGRTLMKGEREAKTVKLGDRIGDYKVASIQEDRIVMESAGDSFEVLLYDPNAPKKRMEVKTPVQPVAVTSSVAGPAPTPGAPAAPAPAAAPRTPPGSPTPGVQPVPPIPQPAPQTAPANPAELKAGTALQPSESQTSPPTPGTGIWRGRRPFQPANPAAPQGN